MKLLPVILLLCLSSCTRPDVDPPQAVLPVPTESQLAWHAMEMNAFVHFTTNTFTDKEWGYGDEEPGIFNPTMFDADQWVRTFKETGFAGVVLTCKHHDGFCLWPSQYTSHSVKSTSWMNGQGDVVRAVSDACKKYGLKFGVYLSPWDRNHKDYGTPAYIDYYRKQVVELFNQYGPVFEMWFDGANGGDGYYGGARERRAIQGEVYYDWPGTLDLVRTMNPNVIFFSDAGPGVRWVGNEKGIAGETNWGNITPDTLYAGKAGIENLLTSGSENGTHWIPAETDVSIRPGWFYHSREDSLVKTPGQLFDIYLTSVGRGSTLLLNVPPDRQGLLHEKDVAALKGFRTLLDQTFRNDLGKSAVVSSVSFRGNSTRYAPANVMDDDPATYWTTDDEVKQASIEFTWKEEREIRYVVIQEYLTLGQRVQRFTIDAWVDDEWRTIRQGTTIGYKRILDLGDITTERVRLTIHDSKACPLIQSIQIF